MLLGLLSFVYPIWWVELQNWDYLFGGITVHSRHNDVIFELNDTTSRSMKGGETVEVINWNHFNKITHLITSWKASCDCLKSFSSFIKSSNTCCFTIMMRVPIELVTAVMSFLVTSQPCVVPHFIKRYKCQYANTWVHFESQGFVSNHSNQKLRLFGSSCQ